MNFERFNKILSKTLGCCLIFFMAIMVFTVVWQVFTRFILNDPSVFTDELSRYLLIWIGILGGTYTYAIKRHLALELLMTRLSVQSNHLLNIFICFLIFLFATITLLYGGLNYMLTTLHHKQVSPGLSIFGNQLLIGYIYIVAPLSGLLICYYSVIDAYQSLKAFLNGSNIWQQQGIKSIFKNTKILILSILVLFISALSIFAFIVGILPAITEQSFAFLTEKTLLDSLFTMDFLDSLPNAFYDLVPIIVLFGSLAIFLMLGVPIAFAIGGAALLTIFIDFPINSASILISQHMLNGLNSFGLLALPFFIVAGNLMNRGGLANRLINFAMLLGGKLPGSLAHVNVIANMMFGSLSGSAAAAAAAVGGIMKPLQEKHQYPKAFSTAVNVASCPSGLLIPPSNILILYALTSSTSVQYLFIAGYIPGILMGIGIMIGIFLLGKRYKIPQTKIVQSEKAIKVIWDAIPSLFLVIIIMGGILKGAFTATEASAIAVVYSLILGFAYRELKFKDLAPILLDSVITTSIVLLMIATSSAMSWSMANADIPNAIAEFVLNFSTNPIAIMLLINLILLVVGTFMDMSPAVLIFTPIFLPIAIQLGIDPIHFGIIMVFNLCIGICTPPVGTALFVGCSVSGNKLGEVVPKLLPLFLIMILTLLLIILIPSLTMWLPRLAGYQ